ncbi:globin family protein [Deinococcus hopiensis]|uniref:Hemoglobin-like flavoprotein n=1 Tax=Deinococcus hopiensis KR-140 TaxID=695939 RepID=A0A1W1USN6_9DEIO|nr:globin family protein [Deinococcus hopiensis]SMB84040.1 Hemoglobin-like flavoprotein [Deinococcus hopiensis KR-140]
MTDDQIQLVQHSFTFIETQAEFVAARFYERLFALDPALKALFRGDLAEQGRKLMSALRLVVRGLDHLPPLLPAVRELGARHASFGVQHTHYALVGTALLGTLNEVLGDAFTTETREAWLEAYETLATVMQDAALDLAAAPHRYRGGLR